MDYDSRRVGARSLRVSHVIKIKSRFALVAWDTSMKKLLQNCETCQSVVSLSLSFHFRIHDGLYFKHEGSNTHTSRGYWVMKENSTWDATSVTASFRLGPRQHWQQNLDVDRSFKFWQNPVSIYCDSLL